MSLQILITITFFAGMGLAALISPQFVVSFFGISIDTPDASNEVRAVYGGFGLAIAALLISTSYMPTLKPGILLTVAVALAGMASGRVIGALIERPGKWPLIIGLIEVFLTALLLHSLKNL